VSPLIKVHVRGCSTKRNLSKPIIDISLVSNDCTTRIKFKELRVLDHNFSPNIIQLNETVEVVRRLVEYHILYRFNLSLTKVTSKVSTGVVIEAVEPVGTPITLNLNNPAPNPSPT
jgi:hypothetical protein